MHAWCVGCMPRSAAHNLASCCPLPAPYASPHIFHLRCRASLDDRTGPPAPPPSSCTPHLPLDAQAACQAHTIPPAAPPPSSCAPHLPLDAQAVPLVVHADGQVPTLIVAAEGGVGRVVAAVEGTGLRRGGGGSCNGAGVGALGADQVALALLQVGLGVRLVGGVPVRVCASDVAVTYGCSGREERVVGCAKLGLQRVGRVRARLGHTRVTALLDTIQSQGRPVAAGMGWGTQGRDCCNLHMLVELVCTTNKHTARWCCQH
jgi:hypothetical protein